MTLVSMANLGALQTLNASSDTYVLDAKLLFCPLNVDSVLSFRSSLCAVPQRGSLPMLLSLSCLFSSTILLFIVTFSFLASIGIGEEGEPESSLLF